MNASAACKLVHVSQPPVMNFRGKFNSRDVLSYNRKVVFVMGATGTGKSRLAIDLAIQHPAEVINSDKMQVYKGLDIITNKVTHEETQGVPHHLMDFVDPDSDYTASDFCYHTCKAVNLIHSHGRIPIVAGGSNSFLDALVNHNHINGKFQRKYRCCFLWVDVALSVLESSVSKRVDRMVRAGLEDEARDMYDPRAHDYSKGIRRAIGVSELDQYFQAEAAGADGQTLARLLESGIAKIKENTQLLASRQLQKIHGLYSKWGSQCVHRIDATEVFLQRGKVESDEAWERLVLEPSAMIVDQFLFEEKQPVGIPMTPSAAIPSVLPARVPMAAVSGATH
ncbi:hypothetical protein SAY87_032201 [Trapa incisa]|uniref:adenylate dimethylallyltransferase (ADP/ATP-dependent) n=1 Tax=Trapa incisa TaxID=236973 RepID=A0AAN7KSD9_9MYRT|nr:hypothetical protein SAY87_032201 [Trapa incisa]